jgi:hypothetical protein
LGTRRGLRGGLEVPPVHLIKLLEQAAVGYLLVPLALGLDGLINLSEAPVTLARSLVARDPAGVPYNLAAPKWECHYRTPRGVTD